MTMLGLTLPDLTLLRPWWLLAVPVLVLIALRFGLAGGLGSWRRAVDAPLLAAIEQRGGVVAGSGGRRLSPWLAAAVIAAIALAGPALERSDSRTFRNLDGIVFALDLSQSMTDSGSLADAQVAMVKLAEAAAGRQIAFIVYAGDAYLGSPFSADVDALRPLVLGSGAGVVPDTGSDPARALALARAVFDEAAMVAGDVVLVGDGDGIGADALAAAAALRAEGRRVHAMFVPPSTRVVGSPEPHPAAASDLAAAGGGRFVAVGDTATLAAELGSGDSERLGAGGYAALVWTDFGRLLLLGAAIPILALFRRRA